MVDIITITIIIAAPTAAFVAGVISGRNARKEEWMADNIRLRYMQAAVANYLHCTCGGKVHALDVTRLGDVEPTHIYVCNVCDKVVR